MTEIITTSRRFKDRFGLADLRVRQYKKVGPTDRASLLAACTRAKDRWPGWNYYSVSQVDGGVAIFVTSVGRPEAEEQP